MDVQPFTDRPIGLPATIDCQYDSLGSCSQTCGVGVDRVMEVGHLPEYSDEHSMPTG